jgi:hypothetical protein
MVALALILFVAWLLGFIVFKVSSGLIHLLLVIAAVVFIWRLLTGSRVTRV